MPSQDLKAIAEKMVEATKGFVVRSLAPLTARLTAIEARMEGVSAPMDARVDALLSRTATLETRLAAVTMMLPSARGKASEDISEFVSMIERLETRIKALEDRPSVKYSGIWTVDHKYVENEFCTHAGSLWACRETTLSRPGTDSTWTLAAKHGRDGRDLR